MLSWNHTGLQPSVPGQRLDPDLSDCRTLGLSGATCGLLFLSLLSHRVLRSGRWRSLSVTYGLACPAAGTSWSCLDPFSLLTKVPNHSIFHFWCQLCAVLFSVNTIAHFWQWVLVSRIWLFKTLFPHLLPMRLHLSELHFFIHKREMVPSLDPQ